MGAQRSSICIPTERSVLALANIQYCLVRIRTYVVDGIYTLRSRSATIQPENLQNIHITLYRYMNIYNASIIQSNITERGGKLCDGSHNYRYVWILKRMTGFKRACVAVCRPGKRVGAMVDL